MPTPLLVIISGAPASGKTTLGKRLAADCRLPFVGKDDFKEVLFDTLGTGDRDWSRRLGIATYHLLYHCVAMQLKVGRSLIVESNFRGEFAAARFLDLKTTYGFEPFQILCRTERDVLLERFKRRARSGERHPGHLDALLIEEFAAGQQDTEYDFLPLGGTTITVDTTDFANVNYPALVAAVSAAANSAA